MASSIAINHRRPASPACWEINHSRIEIASSSASADISTRKAILPAHLGKELGGRPSATGVNVVKTATDTFDGFLEILALPFKVRRQHIVEGCGGILPVPLSVVFQLRSALWLEGYCFHRLASQFIAVAAGWRRRMRTNRPERYGAARIVQQFIFQSVILYTASAQQSVRSRL